MIRLRLSYSAISTYQTCPAQYRFRYVERLPSIPGPSLSFGRSVHEALKWFYDVPTPDPRPLPELLEYLETCWVGEGYSSAEEEARYFYQAKSTLEQFYRKNAPAFRLPAALEQGFSIDMGGFELSGVIDRMDKSPEGWFEIIDYKTNRRLPPAKRLSEDLQLPIYHLAAERVWEVSPERVTFYYLLLDHRHSVPVSNTWKEAALERIGRVAGSIDSGRFEPRENPLCPWCDYLDICPLMSGRAVTRKRSSSPPLDVGQAVDELFAARKRIAGALVRVEGLEDMVRSYLRERGLSEVRGGRGSAVLETGGGLDLVPGEARSTAFEESD